MSMQACAAGYALTCLSTLRQQLDTRVVAGLTTAKFTAEDVALL
jgi:hypothetical protein